MSMNATATAAVEIAPEGVSALSCPACDTHYSLEEEARAIHSDIAYCINGCGVTLLADMKLSVRASNAHLIDAQNAKNAIWFHATTVADWHESLLATAVDFDPNSLFEPVAENFDGIRMAHLGTMDTAMERAYQRVEFEGERAETWYFYKISLTDDAQIDAEIKVDENDEMPELAGFCEGSGYSTSVTRYINRWEATGSISVLANPRHFTVEDVQAVPSVEVSKRVQPSFA